KIRHVKYSFRAAMRGDPEMPWTWWSDIEQGGGALGAIGSHAVDTIRWLTGSEVKEVTCRLHTHIKQRLRNGRLAEVTSDDEVLLILKLAGGDHVEDATASVSTSMVEAGPPRNRVELFGAGGAIRVEDGGELFCAEIKANEWLPIDIDLGEAPSGCTVGGWSRGFKALAVQIVETLISGETRIEHAATFNDGLAVQHVLDAARRSSELRKTVLL
ncbi:MAG: Gfo/Idh/MocA family oxidoreductase, partial [Acidobacteriota bacterium]|nr:Gfo/Idh/MocA family oxidoreductase [Acidobacteriota bacterium]